MGLTIHYKLRLATDAKGARQRVQALYERAAQLPFDQVHPTIEHGSPDATPDEPLEPEFLEWMQLWGTHYLELPDRSEDDSLLMVPPLHILRFSCLTSGAETAGFGLASHPATIRDNKTGRTISTGLEGLYTWHGFCKTQYASAPQLGGIDNFLRAHVTIVEVLDAAAELGFEVSVTDEGNYWQTRDRNVLTKELQRMNGLVAAFTGKLKDALGNEPGRVQASITEYSNFEHLEAEGLKEFMPPPDPHTN